MIAKITHIPSLLVYMFWLVDFEMKKKIMRRWWWWCKMCFSTRFRRQFWINRVDFACTLTILNIITPNKTHIRTTHTHNQTTKTTPSLVLFFPSSSSSSSIFCCCLLLIANYIYFIKHHYKLKIKFFFEFLFGFKSWTCVLKLFLFKS